MTEWTMWATFLASGAGGAIAVEITARADPDGHTISLISAGHTVLSASGNPIPYNLEKDLQAVAQAHLAHPHAAIAVECSSVPDRAVHATTFLPRSAAMSSDVNPISPSTASVSSPSRGALMRTLPGVPISLGTMPGTVTA